MKEEKMERAEQESKKEKRVSRRKLRSRVIRIITPGNRIGHARLAGLTCRFRLEEQLNSN